MIDEELCEAPQLDLFETRTFHCQLPAGHPAPWHDDKEGHQWRDAPLCISV